LISFYEENPMVWKFTDPRYNCIKDKPVVLQALATKLGEGVEDKLNCSLQ